MSLFPLTIASGDAFCNRAKERVELVEAIRSGNHVWIQASRRHGKTSLIMQSLVDARAYSKAPVFQQRIDLLMAADKEAIANQILRAVGQLAVSIPEGKFESAWQKLSSIFHRLKPEVTLTAKGPTLNFALRSGPEEIKEALLRLDDLAGEFEARAVLVLDEFQRLGELDKSFALEAAIRHAAERVRSITLVFLGSNRRLMAQAFTDKERPLYRHCRTIDLHRIPAAEYRTHIHNAWQGRLSDDALEAIITLTERHPYYINNLCNHLWSQDSPTPKLIEKIWNEIVNEVRRTQEAALLRLTANQRRLLIALSHETTDQPTSKAFVSRTQIASGSMEKALQAMIENDYIDRDENGYLFVVDPAIAAIAREISRP